MITRPRPALAVVLLALLATAACDATPDYVKEQARQKRLADLGIERFDSAGRFDLAGMSTHREIEIQALKPRELEGDTLGPDYRTFHMRCGSCHEVPSPSSKPAYLWEASLSRMKKNAADAGLMPMAPEDEASVLRFLREHAADPE